MTIKGSTFTDPGATVIDYDNDVDYTTGTVDSDTGSYTITYTATDSSGNTLHLGKCWYNIPNNHSYWR